MQSVTGCISTTIRKKKRVSGQCERGTNHKNPCSSFPMALLYYFSLHGVAHRSNVGITPRQLVKKDNSNGGSYKFLAHKPSNAETVALLAFHSSMLLPPVRRGDMEAKGNVVMGFLQVGGTSATDFRTPCACTITIFEEA